MGLVMSEKSKGKELIWNVKMQKKLKTPKKK